MTALDTNLLIYAHRSATAEHGRAKAAIDRLAASDETWGIALATVSEFWSVVTHPRAGKRPSRPEEARAFIEALQRDGGMEIWSPNSGFGERLTLLARDRDISGPRIFDLQIALTAREAGAAEIWTHDAGFLSLAGMRVRDPIG